MAESMENSDSNSALKNTIDTMFENIRRIDSDLDFLRTKRHNQLTTPYAVTEIEHSLEDKLKLLNNTKAAINSEIDTVSKFINEKHEETAKIKLAKEVSGKQQLEQLIKYENVLKDGLPKFRNALRIYNDEYLTKEINEIRNERRKVEEKIENLEPKILALVSKYKLDEIESIDQTAITEPLKLRQIWLDSNLARVSVRKLYEYSNQELEEKIKLNERKIARST